MIVVVGLAFEARIAAGDGVRVICSGDGRNLANDIDRAIGNTRAGLVSFGVAGGLAPHLRPGACVIASEIIDGDRRVATDHAWAQRLLMAHPNAIHAPLAGVGAAVARPQDKRVLHEATGAVAVDMESHVVARAAQAHGLPFLAVRVVTDPAERALPRAALAGVRPDGTTDIAAVLRALARRPHDLAGLLRVALDTRAARAELLRSRQVLGASLVSPHLGELALDLA